MRGNQPTRVYPDMPQRALDPSMTNHSSNSEDGGFFANLIGNLDIGFKSVTTELQKLRQQMPGPTAPVLGTAFGVATIAATGTGIVRLSPAGPDQGRVWYIKSIMVGGLTVLTPALGRADVYVSASDLGSGGTPISTPPFTAWRDQALSLPLRAEYGDRQLALRLNEELYVMFSSATVGQQYVAVCTFLDFAEGTAGIIGA